MKRSLLLSVSVAALFAVAPAAAQNNSTVRQGTGGSSNSVTVAQQRSVGADVSLVEQNFGSGNSGTGNSASVTQQGPSVSNSSINDSKVYQRGTSDTATVTQRAYTPLTNGEKNVSVLTQTGTGAGSDATVEQVGHNNSGVTQANAGNTATVRQGNLTSGQPVGGNVSTLTQDGDDTATVEQNYVGSTGSTNYGGNGSTVDQGSGMNEATVSQTGLTSTSRVLQSGGSTASVTQNGDDEDSTVNQTGGGTATVTQSDSQNRSNVQQFSNAKATVTQTGSNIPALAALSPPNNNSLVVQNSGSDGAEATVTQAGLLNYSSVAQNADATATVKQTGGYDFSYVTQDAANATATVTQGNVIGRDGDNKSTVTQNAGATGATATVYQRNQAAAPVGGFASNDSEITQSGAGSRADVDQNGNDQVSRVTQVGASNEAEVDQTGTNNNSFLTQNGSANAAGVTQTANGALSTVTQNSDNNNATVIQDSAATSTVTQGGSQSNPAPGFNGRRNNVANVTQTSGAAGSSAQTTQNGVLNKSDITQSAVGTVAQVSQANIYNTSTVGQTGAGAKATVSQGGGYGDNKSTVTQSAGATATVTQTGQPSVGPALTNTSVVTQSAVANATVGQNGSNNRSGVDQSGTNATATLSQDGSFLTSDIIQTAGATATTSQRGTGNTAMVTQDATATSTVEQGLINTASSGNSATVQQQSGSAGSFSEVRQDGIGNSAGVLQTAANNDSFVRVEGNSNSATVTQNGSGNAQRVRVVGDPALGDGTPTGNVAITTQTATAHDNWSSTAQQGDNNRVEITQSGVGVRVATQTDRSYNNYRFNEPPEADVWQVSDNNKAYIDQASDASRVTIYQGLEQVPVGTGSYKYALGGNNEARVTQLASADNSRADVIQGGSNHIANVTQSGLNSDSYVNQAGTGHTATVSQTGSDNDSFLVQFGTGNTATVTQASNNNVSTIDQSGSSNTVTVTQGL